MTPIIANLALVLVAGWLFRKYNVVQEGAEKVPTFFVFGPNAKRSDDFWPSFMKVETSFQPVGDSRFHPSDLVLLDLFSPQWLQSHPESSEQKVEVFRVVNSSAGSSP